ncbi:MAG: hypothetical protein QM669_12930 [Siphonobacter sp.]
MEHSFNNLPEDFPDGDEETLDPAEENEEFGALDDYDEDDEVDDELLDDDE